MSNSGVENTVPILQTATPLATAADKPNILRVDPPSSYWFWIKTLFLVLMIVVLGLNVYYYMTEGVTLFAKMMGEGIENTQEEETIRGAEAIEKVLQEPEESENINKKEDTIESKKEIISKLRQRIHKGKNSKKNKDEKNKDKKNKKEEEKIPKSVPSPDLSSHDDLNHQKKQYCYVGNLGGKRHCAEIEQSDKCISGDIFPSESICVNPNLRK